MKLFLIGHVALIAVASGYQLAACRTASAVVTPTAAVAPVARTGDVLMGRGDKRTAKGKRKAKSFGVSRPSSRNLRVAKFGPGPNTGDITAAAAPAPAPAAAPKMADIVDTAVGAGAFKTLAAALGAAGLVDTMKSAGPFTVFAPTDDAFAKLPAGTVEELLKPENKAKLAAILTYHVVSGKVMASAVVTMDGAKVPTVNGAEVSIKVGADGVMVDGAKVVTTDVECTNGVIHIIDSVILPAAAAAPVAAAAAASSAPTAEVNLGFSSMLIPSAVLAKAGLTREKAGMLKQSVLAAKSGVPIVADAPASAAGAAPEAPRELVVA